MAAIGHLREFNVSVSDWTIYKVQLTNYFAANNITDPAIKRAIFLNCCSESSFQLLNSLCIPDTPQDKDFNNLLKYFDTYFAPAKLVFPERQKFYNCSKAKEESVQEWAARVRQLASRCNFKTAELSTILRDKFIMGFEKGPIMDRLFEEDETKLTFEMAIEVACRKEATCKTEVAFGNVKKEEMEMYYSKTKLGPEFPEKKSKHGYERKLFEKKRTTECDVCEGSIPKFFKPRPIAFALKEKVEKEIDRLVEENILTPVDYSDYATPIVPVLKSNGSVRICGDYSVTLNPNLEIDKFPLPRIEELFTKLQGGTIFTKIDLSSAFQQVELDDESKKLTTISTHRGLFFYNRLPFGIHSGPSKFQKIMEKVLVGFEDVTCFQDDILISSKDIKEHIDKVRSVLHKMSECGLTVEKNKNGLHKSKEKIDAILKVPYPQNVTQLKSFLGMVNYYNRFIPNASSLLKPLYKLLQKNSSWKFDTACVHSFETVKRVLGSETILVHFNSQQTVHLFVDASQYGLGAVIMHIIEGSFRPIAYASRTLSQKYLNRNGIKLKQGPPYHPATNGQAENSVKNIKLSLLKALEEKDSISSIGDLRLDEFFKSPDLKEREEVNGVKSKRIRRKPDRFCF
ncbi:uncharacterized protein LOC123680910 [Harmonia axyridis]|uniref:uncharacterized protein LOC123680910 n=1 Tax=Harmonia axyridis TaxID=115357 RepID=UPI001E2792C9|nr:uncharacterized protein LOC123680910 [Harmonia axyridis]